MSELQHESEWYYIGHYGPLGPLTLEQMRELARDGVIDRETHVWQGGMTDWVTAERVQPLMREMAPAAGIGTASPPPVPTRQILPPAREGGAFSSSAATAMLGTYAPYGYESLPKSDKSRALAGLLNFLPGIGRFYLGYAAHGVLQLVLTVFTCGLLYIWPLIDAIYILSGGLKLDGYGRRLED